MFKSTDTDNSVCTRSSQLPLSKEKNNFFPMTLNILWHCMKTIMSSDKGIGKNQMNPLAMSAHHLHAKNSDKTFSPRQDIKEHVH
jgi:hypothetical protein